MNRPSRQRPARPGLLESITLHEFQALDQTHIEIVQQLRRLEQVAARIDSAGADPESRKLAASICAFFDGTARAHHEEEEQIVFPPLLSSDDADLVQTVQRLQQDHGWIEEDWRELRASLGAFAEGHSGYDAGALRQMCEVFSTLCLEHIALEESLIYPEAKRRLLTAARPHPAAAPSSS